VLGVRLTVSHYATPYRAASRLRSGIYNRAVSRRSLPWLIGALGALFALALIDIITGDRTFARTWYLLPALAVALRGSPSHVAIVAVVAVALAALAPVWNDQFSNYFIPLVTVVSGSAIAVWGARERYAAEAARSAADAERRQLHLLAEAARITDGAADIDEALRRLVDMLVPDVADAAWVDVIGRDGIARRLAARVDGPHARELEEWLMFRGAARRRELSPTTRSLRGEGPQLAELTEPLREAMIHDDYDRRHLEMSGLRWTMALPLAPSGGPLGSLGLGVGPSGRTYGEAELAFARLLVGRAGLALANAQLVGRLTAAQRRLDGILGSLAEAVTVQDGAGHIVYANQAAATLLGLPDVHAVLTAPPGSLADRFEIRDADGNLLPLERLPGVRVLRGETPPPLLTQSVYKATGELHWFLTKATPLEDETGELLAVNVIEDVTEEHEAALRERFLAEAGQALASSLDYEETLQRVAQLAVPRLADWCAIELPDDRGRLQQVALAHTDPARVEAGRAMRERYPPDPDAALGTPAVLRSGRPQLIAEVSAERLAEGARTDERLAALQTLGLSSVMIVPMTTGGRTLGAMSFLATDSGRRYNKRDLAFAQELAARAATAIENARLYTERSDVAQTLQASLLPDELPEVPGWRLAADYRPGQRGAEVGGDFYDVFVVAGGHLVVLGDVTGKGVRAAALTSLVRYTARTASAFDPRPSAVLAQVHRALRERPRLAPVTMVCGLLRRGGELTLAVGGHPLPLLKRADGVDRLGETGMLLGAVHDYEPSPEVTTTLAAGDTLLLYTDGVTDLPGEEERFGDARLVDTVAAAPSDPCALIASVSEALDAFSVGATTDDRAMLALRRAR
jgi:serine phosphatase RsbU (regulator of sigma subunit)/PAS domain-containing protein